MSKKYFGTDGIRGRVGQYPMTADFVLKLGWALGKVTCPDGGSVLIGKDTRISGYMLESALEAGLSAAGANVRLLGPMPTPAIAYLTRTFRANAGVVISASHNPFHDNGVKFFCNNGLKLGDEKEATLEAMLDEEFTTVDSSRLGKVERIDDAPGRYIEFCKSTIPTYVSLRKLKIVVDCANGAAYHIAPHVFSELGATVITIGNQPNGMNINMDCGSTHPEHLQKAVLEHQADLGIALDGDADRLIMVDHKGHVVDGDELLYVIAASKLKRNKLRGPVVGTLMSNLGLEQALQAQDVEFLRANVGDRYVMEMLLQHGGIIGGESSGHILCLDKATTGDGTVSALQVLHALHVLDQSLYDARRGMSKYPQTMINVPIKRRLDPSSSDSIQAAVTDVETRLNGKGRVLLRPSGTEPVIRVMVEGEDSQQIGAFAQELANCVQAAAAV